MHVGLRLLLSLSVVVLTSCGSSGTTPSTSQTATTPTGNQAAPSVAGNWYFAFPSTAPLSSIGGFLGSISVQDSTITGIFRINDPNRGVPCIAATQNISFSGSVDSSNVVTLTSQSFAGSVATITFPLTAIGSNIFDGSGQITGSTCSFSSRQMLAEFVPSITGTYTGSLALNPEPGPAGPSGAASMTLNQGPANADGQFPIDGSLSFSSSGCNISTTLAGTLTGPFLSLQADLSGLSATGVVSNITGNFNASSLTFHVAPSTTGCAAGWYGGTLTRH